MGTPFIRLTRFGLFLTSFMVCNAARGESPTEAERSHPFNLPQRVYGLKGERQKIRFENLFYASSETQYHFDAALTSGAQFKDYLEWNPTHSDHERLVLSCYSSVDSKKLAECSATMISIDLNSVQRKKGKVRWLAVGDSLTANGTIVKQTVGKMRHLGVGFELLPVGTQGSGAIKHEGRGGWSWHRYLTSSSGKKKSPFVFETAGEPVFDFQRYLDGNGGTKPKVITLFLGVNDVFSISADYSKEKVVKIIDNAKLGVEKIKKAAPNSVLGIIPPPPPSDQNAFTTNYGLKLTEWQYRRALQVYVTELLKAFDGRWDERIFIVPGYLAFDAKTSYPMEGGISQNALHPTAQGYQPLSDAIGAWILFCIKEGLISPESE